MINTGVVQTSSRLTIQPQSPYNQQQYYNSHHNNSNQYVPYNDTISTHPIHSHDNHDQYQPHHTPITTQPYPSPSYHHTSPRAQSYQHTARTPPTIPPTKHTTTGNTPSYQWNNQWNKLNSIFIKQLQHEINRFPGSAWGNSFIDYARLRQQLDDIVSYQQVTTNNNNLTALPVKRSYTDSSTYNNPHIISRDTLLHDQTTNQYTLLGSCYCTPLNRSYKQYDLFWSILKSEIHKTNQYFAQQQYKYQQQLNSIQLNSHFNQLIDVYDTSYTYNSPTNRSNINRNDISYTFIKLLYKAQPDLCNLLIDRATVYNAQQYIVNECHIDILNRFLSVCSQLDWLNKYIVLNYIVLLRIVKKYDQLTHSKSQNIFLSQYIDDELFNSTQYNILLNRCEIIINSLIQRKSIQQSELQCPICNELYVKPVVLNCTHRLCFICLTTNDEFVQHTQCPICHTRHMLDARCIHVDSVLSRYVGASTYNRQQQIDEYQNKYRLQPHHTVDNQSESQHKRDSTQVSTVHPSDVTMKRNASWNDTSMLDDTVSTTPSQYTTAELIAVNDSNSCHRCKSSRKSDSLVYCTNKSIRKHSKHPYCRKKYCITCLLKLDTHTTAESYRTIISTHQAWICPSCSGTCTCAACRRKSNTQSIRKEQKHIQYGNSSDSVILMNTGTTDVYRDMQNADISTATEFSRDNQLQPSFDASLHHLLPQSQHSTPVFKPRSRSDSRPVSTYDTGVELHNQQLNCYTYPSAPTKYYATAVNQSTHSLSHNNINPSYYPSSLIDYTTQSNTPQTVPIYNDVRSTTNNDDDSTIQSGILPPLSNTYFEQINSPQLPYNHININIKQQSTSNQYATNVKSSNTLHDDNVPYSSTSSTADNTSADTTTHIHSYLSYIDDNSLSN